MRRFGALLLLVVTTVGACLLVALPATADAPGVASWWNVAYVCGGTTAPPLPPGVAAGDLYVAGSNTGAVVSSCSTAPSTAQAVAGLIFTLPASATVGTLTLPIDGTPPTSTSVIACRATTLFKAEQNASWADVPPYECPTTPVTAQVSGSNLVLSGLQPLVAADQLAIVLLPGPLDRVVLKAPTASALAVTAAPATGDGGSVAPVGGGTTTAPVTGTGSDTGGAVGTTGGGVVAPPIDGAITPPAAGSVTAPDPQVASPQGGTGSSGSSATAVAYDKPDMGRRRLLAVLLVVAEVVGFALLQRSKAGPVAVAMGGRLRSPDRTAVAAGAAPAEPAVRGVGRFAKARTGPVPDL